MIVEERIAVCFVGAPWYFNCFMIQHTSDIIFNFFADGIWFLSSRFRGQGWLIAQLISRKVFYHNGFLTMNSQVLKPKAIHYLIYQINAQSGCLCVIWIIGQLIFVHLTRIKWNTAFFKYDFYSTGNFFTNDVESRIFFIIVGVNNYVWNCLFHCNVNLVKAAVTKTQAFRNLTHETLNHKNMLRIVGECKLDVFSCFHFNI